MNRFDGKVVLVTAGASGIGAATARAFAREGGKVILADVSDDAGQAVADELAGVGLTARYMHMDATSEDDHERVVAAIVEEFGKLDVAANIVGNSAPGQPVHEKLHEGLLEHFRGTLDLNLVTTFLGMKHQIKQMLKQGTGGAIANTSSMAGVRHSWDATAAYAAAKAGIVHMSEFAAVRYAKDNIRVNVVAPGLTATPAVRGAFTEDQLSEMASRTQPMGRCMEPGEQADAFLWLCSDQASAVTGLTVPVAGGWAAA